MKVQLSGGAYQARSVVASAQRALNLYAEPMPSVQGEPAQFAYYPTDGLYRMLTMPTSPVRGIYQIQRGNGFYVVAGAGVYYVPYFTVQDAVTPTLLGSITALRPYPVSMATNGETVVLVDGTPNGYTIDASTNAFAPITDSAFYGADKVDFMDGYFLFNKQATPQFYTSDFNATTFDPLYFADKLGFSDNIMTLAVAKREIWLLGERTTEIWYNAGASDFPFQAMQTGFIDLGCAAKYSVATYDNQVYWVGTTRAGEGIIISGGGYQARRVSTYAIENAISNYAAISDAYGFVYLSSGHAFYAVSFPQGDTTFVYDITTQQWHEWCWIDSNGDEHMHRAGVCGDVIGGAMLGDRENGNLYVPRKDVFTDNGSPIKRQRAYPHIINDSNRVFYSKFVADIESGNPGGGSGGSDITTLLSTTFTAPDGTLLSDYSDPSDTNATWSLVAGSESEIENDQLAGPAAGGSSSYTSVAMPDTDYTLQFQVIPPSYDTVGTQDVYVIARYAGAGTGYRAMVAGDGSEYQLTLGVESHGSTTVAMGTLTSGFYAITLLLTGSSLTLSAWRSQDGYWLNSSAAWVATKVPAITLTDATYTAAGAVIVGGDW